MTESFTAAQKIFLRQLAGEQVRYTEYSKVRTTKATPRPLERRGLIEYGRRNGSVTMGWHLTETGRPVAEQLIRTATERRKVAQ